MMPAAHEQEGGRTTIEPEGYRLTIVPDAATMSRRAAGIVAATIALTPEAAIAVPTGSTPLGMYEDLLARVRSGTLDVSRTHVYCLDEYLGVAPTDPNSLTGWLAGVFLTPAKVPPAHVHPVPATDPDPASAAARFEAELAARGGLKLAVLGLGANGHIAYNEPPSAADSRTRVLPLTPESIAQAATYWQGTLPIPDVAMTVGIGTLLEAHRIVLIVAGAAKAAVLRRTLREPMTDAVPASWLRLAGSRLEVIADQFAAAQLG